MEDNIEMLLQDKSLRCACSRQFAMTIGAVFTGFYGMWAMFCLPGFRVPFRLKVPFLPSPQQQTHNVLKLLEGRKGLLADLGSGDGRLVPFLPSPQQQTHNVLKLLEGRKGLLADLGSGDGRLVLRAWSMGFQCTGYEVNPVLLAYSRARVWWRGIPSSHIRFLSQDFWKTDLSNFQNVTVFLAPAVMEQLELKLRAELPPHSRVVVCRFPFPNWPHSCTQRAGLEQVWAYDVPERTPFSDAA